MQPSSPHPFFLSTCHKRGPSSFSNRVVVPTTSLVVTTIHGLRLRVGKVEARLCDQNTGSRGSLLLRLRRVVLEQGRGEVVKAAISPKSHRPHHGSSPRRCRSRSRSRSPIAPGKDVRVVGIGRTATGPDGGNVHGEGIGLERGSAGGSSAGSGMFDASRVGGGETLDGSGDASVGNDGRTGGRVRRRSRSGSNGSACTLFSDSYGSSDSIGSDAGSDDDADLYRTESFPQLSMSRAVSCGSKGSALPQRHHHSRSSSGTDIGANVLDGLESERPHHDGGRRTLTRARSARSIWASRGGVPPKLNLFPGQGAEEVLASLGEGSGDEVGGKDSPQKVASTGVRGAGGRMASDGADDSPKGNITAGQEEGSGSSAVAGENGSEDAKEGADGPERAPRRVIGSGRWDDRLDAMSRAAWLGSKQASRRGFNSNTSTGSAISNSSGSGPGGLAAAVGSAAAGSGTVSAGAGSRSSGVGYRMSGSTSRSGSSRPTSSSTGRSRRSSQAGSLSGSSLEGVEGGLSTPFVDPLATTAPAMEMAALASTNTLSSSSVPEEIANSTGSHGKVSAEVSSEHRGSSGVVARGDEADGDTIAGDEAAAAAATSDRIAGSGFLYRVVFDGLNILITLRLRSVSLMSLFIRKAAWHSSKLGGIRLMPYPNVSPRKNQRNGVTSSALDFLQRERRPAFDHGSFRCPSAVLLLR